MGSYHTVVGGLVMKIRHSTSLLRNILCWRKKSIYAHIILLVGCPLNQSSSVNLAWQLLIIIFISH